MELLTTLKVKASRLQVYHADMLIRLKDYFVRNKESYINIFYGDEECSYASDIRGLHQNTNLILSSRNSDLRDRFLKRYNREYSNVIKPVIDKQFEVDVLVAADRGIHVCPSTALVMFGKSISQKYSSKITYFHNGQELSEIMDFLSVSIPKGEIFKIIAEKGHNLDKIILEELIPSVNNLGEGYDYLRVID